MAIFGLGKNKEGSKQAALGSPIDQIMAMKQQGMNNDQVISELENQGYNSSQIFDALNQVNISGGNMDQAPPNMNVPPQDDFSQTPPGPYDQQQFDQPQQQKQINKDEIEEIAEAIIDEKWQEFEEDVKIIIDWKEKTENRVNRIEQQVKDLTNSLDSLHKGLMNKISSYDRNIMDVGTEIKAMEKVFQKVLPSLTENVNKLDRIAKSSSNKISKK